MDPNTALEHVVRGVILVAGTVLLQLLAQFALARTGRLWPSQRLSRLQIGGHPMLVVVAVLILMIATLLQVALWAAVYFQWGELGSFANAFYFSMASFTTVGASDLVLSPQHRLAGALQAAVGMLMFGWSTALIVQVVQQSHHNNGSG